MGYPELAAQQAREALLIDPNTAKAWAVLGKIENDRRNYSKAFEYLRKAKVSDVGDLEVRYNLGVALLHLGEIELAEQQAIKVTSSGRPSRLAWYLRSQIYLEKGEYERSLQMLNEAVQRKPVELPRLLEIAAAFAQQGHHEGARQVYDLAVEAGADPVMIDQKKNNLNQLIN